MNGPPRKGGRYPQQRMEPASIAGRVPPHDLDAEAAVLSAILLNREALDRVLELLKPEHFYSDANGKIFEAAMALAVAGTPIDIVSVASYLRDRESIAQIGGASYLAQLSDATPAVAHVAAHAAVVYEKWRVRQLIATCQRVAAEGYGDVGVVQEFIDSCEQDIYQLARTASSTSVKPLSQVLRAAFQQITAAAARGDRITGISTGYEKLDGKTAGLHAGDLSIVAARPGMGKCLSEGSEILLADGTVATIAEIHRRRRARLLTLGADWKLHVAEPSHFVDDGIKPVFRVTTRLGRRVETTLPHPFLTVHGWRPLAEIQVGDHVAVPRELPVFGDAKLRACEVKLLAYLIGDGGLTSSGPTFTNQNPRLLEEFTEAVRAFGAVSVRPSEKVPSGRTPSLVVRGDAAFIAVERPQFGVRLRASLTTRGLLGRDLARALDVSPSLVSQWSSGRCVPRQPLFEKLCQALDVAPEMLAPDGLSAISRVARNPMVEWLSRLELWGKGAHGKAIPAPIFTLPREELALFLNRLFATDGWASVLESGQAQLGYSTVSERLARQVQHLLLRFGVIASLRFRAVKYRDQRRPAYQLDITEASSIKRFASEIGIFGKEEQLWSAVEAVSGRATHANNDVIPTGIWERLAEAKGDESWSSLARRAGLPGTSNIHVGKRGLSRRRLAAIATALGDGDLTQMASSDVYWDEVVAIEPLGERQVYDLTIPDTHNFIADDVCVHNTSFVLNLAVNVASPRTVASPGPGEAGHGIEHHEPGFGVAVFSLEMPREQLATRMVCSEGRVDLGRLRQGFLQPDDWRRLTESASYLSSLPIWIDDTPAISLLEVRAKVRRIQAEYNREASGTGGERKMGLVVIDYLQLMKGRDGVNSREQEISEISRGLKQLAKELSVPVIALSQLNRAVETRTTKDKRPQLSDLRECVTGDTLVVLADGRRVPVRSLVGTTPEVLAMSAAGKIEAARSDKVWSVGERPIFSVKLASGRSIRATGLHRLFGAEGWRRVEELAVGDRLAIARRLPEPRVVAQAENDLFWDRVVSLDPAGTEEVFDLTVPGPASWLADGIVSHNSGAIEQDADMIIFIYRDEYYNPETTNAKGIAELIIAKQRNGPTGKVMTRFTASCTRFDNLAAGDYPEMEDE